MHLRIKLKGIKNIQTVTKIYVTNANKNTTVGEIQRKPPPKISRKLPHKDSKKRKQF